MTAAERAERAQEMLNLATLLIAAAKALLLPTAGDAPVPHGTP